MGSLSPTSAAAMSPLTSSAALLLTFIVLAGHADVAVAPFPPEHAYHWLNPWIEPWWVHLSKAEQKKVYGHWEKVEPLLVAVANAKSATAKHIQKTLGALAYKLKGNSKSGKIKSGKRGQGRRGQEGDWTAPATPTRPSREGSYNRRAPL